jgi:hypothetical protein
MDEVGTHYGFDKISIRVVGGYFESWSVNSANFWLYRFTRVHFFLCTFAATFNRSAFNRMKPVASSWL